MRKLLFLIPAITILWSCSGDNTSKNTSTNPNTGDETTTQPKGKYDIKSGIVVYKTNMMGMDVTQTNYFDNYGANEAQETEMDVMGTKIHSITIHKKSTTYTIDLVKRTGTKVTTNNDPSGVPDFKNISEELKKDMNLKIEGNEEFLGKNCEKITMDYTQMQMKGSFLVYKGVALKANMQIGTLPVDLVAVQFTENASIPAGKFDIPDDIKF